MPYSDDIMRTFYSILLTFLLISCRSGGPPAGALNEERFVSVYCDLLEASLRSRNTKADSATAAGNASEALEKAGVSREAFQLTRQWYDQDVDRWKTFMEKVTVELERREMKPPPRQLQ
jgi:hypothetical protein